MNQAALLNKLHHIFEKSGRDFSQLLGQFAGNQIATFNAIQQAAVTAANAQNLANSIYGTSNPIVVQVGGTTIGVTGRIINGVLNIGTAFPIP